LSKRYKNLPILNTSPETIYENLSTLIENTKLRKEFGIIGQKYVLDVHNPITIAKKLINLYSN
jgi:hypothetical protein